MENSSATNEESTWLIPSVFRIALVKLGSISNRPEIDGVYDAAKIFREHIGDADREMCAVMMLNPDGRVIGLNIAHIGDATSCPVSPKEIFKPAILCNAYAIVIAHNHPGLSARPSSADWRLTEALYRAGLLLDIELVDHLIIGEDETYSMKLDERWGWNEEE